MSDTIYLSDHDGPAVPVYVARPPLHIKAAVVVVQEIFGVNAHIRALADAYAAHGYLALAPAAFHRVQHGVELGYTQADIEVGVALKAAVQALPDPGVMADLQAAVDYARAYGKVGMVGYCWGGLLAWRCASMTTGLHAAVAYYGGGMTAGEDLTRVPACPVLCHFGERDHAISNESVAAFRTAQPDVEVQVYAAGHGFNCDQRASYAASAAVLAQQRSLVFFANHLT